MKNIYCSFFGHELEVSKKVTYHVKEYRCKRCNAQMTTNGKGEIVPLTPKFQEINSVLERIHNKRASRKLRPEIVQPTVVKEPAAIQIDFSPHFS